MKFIGILTGFLFMMGIIYGIICADYGNVYSNSVIVESPILKVLKRNDSLF